MKLAIKITLIICLGLLLGLLIAFPLLHLQSHSLSDFSDCPVCILQSNLLAITLLLALFTLLVKPPQAISWLWCAVTPLTSRFDGFCFRNKAPPVV